MTRRRVRRGGARIGAGRSTAYPGKRAGRRFYLDLTPAGHAQLDALAIRHTLSRSDIVARLIEAYADVVAFSAPGVVFPGKRASDVRVVLLPITLASRLDVARARTGKSVSDLVEALIAWYAPTTVFPTRA
jgi:hypothetical protein